MERPLYKKLGIKSNSSILVLNPPGNYIEFFTDFPPNVIILLHDENEKIAFVHVFAKTIAELEYLYQEAKASLAINGILWISWPKQASKVETELNKLFIMKYVLRDGMVDVKVVSINKVWNKIHRPRPV